MSGSRKARSTAARLFAVQAVFQALQLEKDPASLIEEYLGHNIGMDLDGGEMVTPDATLFKSIVAGVSARFAEIKEVLGERLQGREPESLLRAILSCGAYEVLHHTDIDNPIIISDYVHVAHGFYDGAEPKLVNAVLDKIKS